MSNASSYDPFARGPLPVGVHTFEVTDSSRERTLPVGSLEAYPGQIAYLDIAEPIEPSAYANAPAFAAAAWQQVRSMFLNLRQELD